MHPFEGDHTDIYNLSGACVASIPYSEYLAFWEMEDRLLITTEGESGNVAASQILFGTSEIVPVEGAFLNETAIEDFEDLFFFGNGYGIRGGEKITIVSRDWEIRGTLEGRIMPTLDDTPYYPNGGDGVSVLEMFFILLLEETDAGSVYHLYNTDLEECSVMNEEEWNIWFEKRFYRVPAHYREFNEGVVYPQLHDLPCEGFTGGTYAKYPYAHDNGICYLFYENTTVTVPVPTDETPDEMNDRYLETVDSNQDHWRYDLQTGHRAVLPDEWKAWKADFYQVSTRGFAAHLIRKQDEYGSEIAAEAMYVLFDNELNEVLRISEEEGGISLLYGGTWYYQDSQVDGVINEKGNWLIRREVSE